MSRGCASGFITTGGWGRRVWGRGLHGDTWQAVRIFKSNVSHQVQSGSIDTTEENI